MKHRVLFVDDEPQVTNALRRALRKEPYEILSACSAEEALKILEREPVDVVVSDERMPGMSGSEFLSVVRQKHPDTIRMILTGHASLDAAIRAINQGEVYRFFTKPCNETDLSTTIRHALEQKDLMMETRRLLRLARHQAALLEGVEKAHPGITKAESDVSDVVIIEDEEIDLETLMKEIETELKSYEDRVGGNLSGSTKKTD